MIAHTPSGTMGDSKKTVQVDFSGWMRIRGCSWSIRRLYSFSHNHGSGKWLYLKGNYYWSDPCLTSVILGGDISGGFSMYLLTKPKQNCHEFSGKNLLILGDLEEWGYIFLVPCFSSWNFCSTRRLITNVQWVVGKAILHIGWVTLVIEHLVAIGDKEF